MSEHLSGSVPDRRIATHARCRFHSTHVGELTRLADRLDVEELREVMSEWFAAVRAEIEAQGGTVEKYIGDAVMAVFGVPTAHEDDPARSLRAALAIRGRLVEVNERLAA